MKYLTTILAIPAILFWQVYAFMSLTDLQSEIDGIEKEVSELKGHRIYAEQKVRYHESKVKHFTIKVLEISAAEWERKELLAFSLLDMHNRMMAWEWDMAIEQLEQAVNSSAWEVKVGNAPIVQQWQKPFNIEHLAWSVAWAETNHCTKWYWLSYNNCFGIKNWNTAQCPKVGINRMCIYERPEDSYEAFKNIRSTRYKGFPNINKAAKRTGNDHAATRLKNVNYFYYNN